MNKIISNNVSRFLLFAILQVVLFKSLNFEMAPFSYGILIFYPLFIILIPMRVPGVLVVLSAFVMGLIMDVFYDSPGVHASASVFVAYIRPFVLKFLSPVGGYKVEDSPSVANFGFLWFVTYACVMLFGHLIFYFSMDAFSLVYIVDILMKTLFTFMFSIGFLLLHQLIFKTRY